MSNGTIGLGVIGCGGFARFAVGNFVQISGVKLIAVADIRPEAAMSMAQEFGVEASEIEDLCRNPNVDLVYLATPPFLHYPQTMAALQAGKHVICEKPLALRVEQADEMIDLAREKNLLLVNNLMQRYNPLYQSMVELIEKKVLGEVLHGFFENYASDERLPPDHWFWARDKGGGIFLEHGVHFFDLFTGWLGEGEVVSAQRTLRPGSCIEEQVQCTARYNGNVLVNFFHGFTNPIRMDRQELRLLFERGDVTLYEWVPTRLRLHALVDRGQLDTLLDLFPGALVETLETYIGQNQITHGRHKAIYAERKILLHYGDGIEKMERYGEMLRAMLTDQIAWIRHPHHHRKMTPERGRKSVAMAAEATRLADLAIQTCLEGGA